MGVENVRKINIFIQTLRNIINNY